MQIQDVIHFWFEELEEKQWWVKDLELDKTITDRFQKHYHAAACGELFSWRETPEGRLAEIICLDQFPRNMFRNTPGAFATDPTALVLAQEAVSLGVDQALEGPRKAFLYMPYMHSESKLIQAESVRLFSDPQVAGNLQFAIDHRAIVDRFGRYPHRNAILGRTSTAEEEQFLTQPGSSF